MIDFEKYYKILGVNKNSSNDEIKKAYKKMALKYHPDKNKTTDTSEKFKEISEAYQILTNKEKYNNTSNFNNSDDFVNANELFKEFFNRNTMFTSAFNDDFFKDVFSNMNINVNNNINQNKVFSCSKQTTTTFQNGNKVETIIEINNGNKKITKIITDKNGNKTINNDINLNIQF